MNHSTTPSALPTHPALVCVLHAHEHAADCPLQEVQLPGVKLITGMADLADCQGPVSSLWIDARLTWRLTGFSALQPQSDMRVVIYNSDHLAPELLRVDHPQLRFVKGGLHPDMLQQAL